MIGKGDILEMRKNVQSFVGKDVHIKANMGRNRIVEKCGTIESTYPNLFVVKVSDTNKKISYSYTDLLTKTVEMRLMEEISFDGNLEVNDMPTDIQML